MASFLFRLANTFSGRGRAIAASAALIFLGAITWRADACTTFSLNQTSEKIMGKSYDWHIADGMVVVNKRNVKKTAFAPLPAVTTATWISKYGSVTFNQYGREFPNGGINEKGLAVEVMVLNETKYPSAFTFLPKVNELQWVQYQLDKYATVQEVIDHVDELRIAKVMAKLHYLVCESSGICASIEWLNGVPVVHTGDALPLAVLTNSTYSASTDRLKSFEGFGGKLPLPSGSLKSLDRFVNTAANVKYFRPDHGAAVPQGFLMLNDVKSEKSSQWQIVYEVANGRAHFRSLTFPEIKTFSTRTFDYDCRTPVKILDMDQATGGEVTGKFVDYTPAANRRLLDKTLKGDLPGFVVAKGAAYPETTTCLSLENPRS